MALIDLRSCFRAPAGQKFVVADLSSIETVVLAWLAGDEELMRLYLSGKAYETFAAEALYHVAVADVTKQQRQVAKSAVLGCGYQLSGGELKRDCCNRFVSARTPWGSDRLHSEYCNCAEKGDEFKTGLWGYAEAMGILMTQAEAVQAVQAYRSKMTKVVQFWQDIEEACKHAVHSGETNTLGPLTIGCVPAKLLWITLPSGRRLHYPRPRLASGKWGRTALTYYTRSLLNGAPRFFNKSLYGGILTENLVQAIARDVLAVGMLRADAEGMKIVGHTHDEIITLTNGGGLPLLVRCMTEPISWAPGLELRAEGYEGEVYKK